MENSIKINVFLLKPSLNQWTKYNNFYKTIFVSEKIAQFCKTSFFIGGNFLNHWTKYTSFCKLSFLIEGKEAVVTK